MQRIDKILSEIKTNKKIDYLNLMQEIHTTISQDTAPELLGILTGILTREINVKGDQRTEFTRTLEAVVEELNNHLPDNLKKYIPSSDVVFATGNSTESNLGIMEIFRQIVIQTLAKTSKHEIWNSLNIEMNTCNEFILPGGPISYILEYLSYSQKPTRILREIAYVAEEFDSNTILEFFESNPTYFGEFMLIAKFSNEPLYTKITNTVYSERRYFKKWAIPALPEVDFKLISGYIREYNWDVISSLIEVRPEIIPELSAAINTGEMSISRKFYVDAVLKQSAIFRDFIPHLGFTFDEMIEICGRSVNFARKFVQEINTEDQMLQFCKILSKKDEKVCLSFLKEQEPQPNFEIFLKALLKSLRLTGSLKEYIVSKYADDRRFFHNLLFYLELDTIEHLLEKYYEKNTSIEFLLRRFHGQDLIIEIHRFENTELALKLIDECVPKFDDKDWIMAMKSLESIRSSISVGTCRRLLHSRPNMRHQVVYLLRRSITSKLWDSQSETQDLIECLEFLEEDCVPVLDSMKKGEIVFILRQSKMLKKRLFSLIKNYPGKLPSNLEFIWGCLREL